MEGPEQLTTRANEAQVNSLIKELQDRKVDTADSNDIAYQASFMLVGTEDDFVGEGHVVRIKRTEDGMHIINTEELSMDE